MPDTMKRRKTYLYSFIAIIILLIIAISLFYFLPNYRISSDEAGNKVLSVKKGIGHFSLEIPSDFRVDEVEIDKIDGYKTTSVYLIGSVSEEGYKPIIGVFVDEILDDAASKAKRRLEDARSFANFKLLSDLSSIKVSDIYAYQYTIQYDIVSNPDIIGSPPITDVDRRVFFNHDDFLWTILLLSSPSTQEQDMDAFDRVLETFRVLD